ncbi:hypothetical protein KQX54_002457 [Cotesia glomerata]|uniref:Uncharacterized protein n=1 Tax=Cotesia glomerata TaxID=32391 RepID=A0AAV7I685_COTGL|nr:hypothetical protein KQX54_002457 [Cotesia glomerata]
MSKGTWAGDQQTNLVLESKKWCSRVRTPFNDADNLKRLRSHIEGDSKLETAMLAYNAHKNVFFSSYPLTCSCSWLWSQLSTHTLLGCIGVIVKQD